jgi:hypothetical protein
MATPLTPTDIGGVLQKAYAGDPKVQALYENFPFYNMLSKTGNTGGESFSMTCVYQAAVRVGSDPTSIYGLVQKAPAAQFLLTPKRQYGYSAIDGLAIAQAGTGMEKKALASFINIVHAENVAVTKTMTKLLALYATRAGTGSLGTIDASTTIGSPTLVLGKVSDQFNFEEGQTLQLTATDGAAPRSGSVIISAIPGNGTLVMTGNITAGVAAAATGDFIVMIGDSQTQTFPGLKSWCPFVAGAKGTFGGVNRDLSPRKLAGLFVDASAEQLTIDAAIAAGLNRFKANEGIATHCWLNPLDYEALAQTGSTNVVVDQGQDREFGFRSLSFVSDGSKVRVYEDSTFAMGEAWILNMSELEMRFVAKPKVDIDDRDGLTIRKVGTSGADSWEMTFVAYPYGICLKDGAAPGRTICGVKLY